VRPVKSKESYPLLAVGRTKLILDVKGVSCQMCQSNACIKRCQPIDGNLDSATAGHPWTQFWVHALTMSSCVYEPLTDAKSNLESSPKAHRVFRQLPEQL